MNPFPAAPAALRDAPMAPDPITLPLRTTKPQGLAGNFLVLAGAEVASKVITLATFAFVARLVGPSGFGYLEFASSIALCAALFVDQGFGVYGAREIARTPSATAQLVTEIAWLRFVLAGVAYAGLYLFVSMLDRPESSKQLVLLYGLTVVLTPLMLQWVFQGYDRMLPVAGMQVLRQGAFALVVFLLLQRRDQLWAVGVAELTGAASVVIVSLWLYRRQFHRGVALKPAFSWRVVGEGSTIGLGQLLWSLRMYGATIVVGMIATEKDVGFFGAAMRLTIGLNAFVWIYFFNLFPSLARNWRLRPTDFQRLMSRSIRTAGWLSLGGGLLWVLLAPFVIRLAYGAAFAGAILPLQWMSGICALGAIHGNFRFGLIAATHERYATLSAGIGTAIALVLIPLGYSRLGLEGATIALLAGEAAVWITSYAFSRRLLQLEQPFLQLARPLAAGAAITLALWALPPQTPLVAGLGITFVGLGLAFCASEAEVRHAAKIHLAMWVRNKRA
jgi:PST family polysaccharide transporter